MNKHLDRCHTKAAPLCSLLWVSMATTEEVTVSMGEVVMVKADGEGDPDDPNKTQVILQLQPITTGYVPKPGVTSLRLR